VATSAPAGPIYLTLPREVLAEPMKGLTYYSPGRRVAASPPGPGFDAIDAAGALLAAAENPLIIAASAGRDPEAVKALADFALRFAVPAIATSTCRPTTPAISATTPATSSTARTRLSSSNATCRGSRAGRTRRRTA